jgi:3-hydroxymyristoyl/3-hydroxydecanoyl-(acyl carrier protein) dehydratase
MWYDLSVRKRPDAEALAADVHVPADSRWFDGHFPGHPVLPGVAQLSMVFELIARAFDEALMVREVSRVRFKQMIEPGDHLAVFAASKPERPGEYAFRITRNDHLVCSGSMTVAAADEQNRQTRPILKETGKHGGCN